MGPLVLHRPFQGGEGTDPRPKVPHPERAQGAWGGSDGTKGPRSRMPILPGGLRPALACVWTWEPLAGRLAAARQSTRPRHVRGRALATVWAVPAAGWPETGPGPGWALDPVKGGRRG